MGVAAPPSAPNFRGLRRAFLPARRRALMTARNSISRSAHHESTRHEVHSSGTFRVSVRRVLTRPDERLTVRACEVDPCDLNAVALADALIATMRTSPACVGLAATQVGEPVR